MLHFHAMRDLMEEGTIRFFDFTEGEGQHKRQMASAGSPCVDLLLLRPSPGNRATLLAIGGFDRGVAIVSPARRSSER